MKREIKFRAWSHKFDKMVYADDSELSIEICNGDIVHRVWKGSIDDEGVELMQYTGLKDKNGKEIYEGDIREGKYGDIDCYWIVVIGIDRNDNPGVCGWPYLISDKDGTMVYNRFIMTKHSSFAKFGNVIGNVYENSELLN